jgi:hypothetical protein
MADMLNYVRNDRLGKGVDLVYDFRTGDRLVRIGRPGMAQDSARLLDSERTGWGRMAHDDTPEIPRPSSGPTAAPHQRPQQQPQRRVSDQGEPGSEDPIGELVQLLRHSLDARAFGQAIGLLKGIFDLDDVDTQEETSDPGGTEAYGDPAMDERSRYLSPDAEAAFLRRFPSAGRLKRTIY